jgi:RNA polymerase sigma-70 factor, ECF subfamily
MSARATAASKKSLASAAADVDDPEVVLMLRVQRDEPGAFAELLQRFWPRIFSRFHRDHSHRQEAEDLAQEVFLRLYRARKHYEPRARFNTWLFQVVQNVARNASRAQRRRRMRLENLGRSQDGSAWPCGNRPEVDSPSQPLERTELADVVRAAMAELGDRQRTALELYEFQDRSCAEIASTLAVTPKAAKSLLYRARIQLRSNLSSLMD